MANTAPSRRRPLSTWEFPTLATSVHEHRKSKSPSAKVRKHYAAVLAFIYRNRFVTANQVQRRFRRFLKSDRTTRRHLAELESLGLLTTQPVNSISPLLPKIYFITARGRRQLKTAFAMQGKSWEESAYDRRRTTGQSFVHIWHELAITEFLLSVWEAAEFHSGWNLSALERRSLRNHPAFEIHRSGSRRVVPDGQLLIQNPDGMILSFLEIDTGTESQRQLAKKLESYGIWADSPAGQDYICELYAKAGAENPQPHFRLLVVVAPKVIDSEASRLRIFHKLIDGQPAPLRKRLWYTSASQLRNTIASSLLTAPIWYRGGSSSNEMDEPCNRLFSL